MRFAEALQAIKERLSLVDIARRYCDLRQNGSRFVAPCPFHQETKPSFYVFADKNTFHCFGCQASGDIIEFYGRVNGLDFRDSIQQLAQEAGITIDDTQTSSAEREKQKAVRSEKQAMLAMHDLAAAHFAACLSRDSGAPCREYIERRGISRRIQEQFGLGWAERDWRSLAGLLQRRGYSPDLACSAGLLSKSRSGTVFDRFRGRLMFPIRNLSNQVIAFGGRIIAEEDEAKYINSADTPIYAKKEHLYGLAQARRGISAKGHALLTEGYMDVLTLHQFGFDNGIGVLGTALTEEQIGRLSGFTSHIGLVFDGDAPGRKAALRSAALLLCRGMACSVILLPDGEDIDSLLRGPGPGAFEELRRSAPDGFSFCVETVRAYSPRDAIAWARDFVARIQVPELVNHYITQLAQKLDLAEDLFRSGLKTQKQSRSCEKFGDLCERDTQILVFLVRYPERLADLREIGADMALATERAKKYWKLIEEHGPDEAVYYLDDKQKAFWLKQRGPQAPPRTNCEKELSWLKHWLDRFYAARQASSLQAALTNRITDFNSDLEFLHAIRDTMRANNEQS